MREKDGYTHFKTHEVRMVFDHCMNAGLGKKGLGFSEQGSSWG